MTNQNEFFVQVIEKAWTDSDFKSALIENPQAAIQEAFAGKVKVFDNVNIIVEDQSEENTVYINIPPAKDSYNDVELSEEQLEAVAGGLSIPFPILPFPTFPTIPIIDFIV